jgi:hypothetical protein
MVIKAVESFFCLNDSGRANYFKWTEEILFGTVDENEIDEKRQY